MWSSIEIVKENFRNNIFGVEITQNCYIFNSNLVWCFSKHRYIYSALSQFTQLKCVCSYFEVTCVAMVHGTVRPLRGRRLTSLIAVRCTVSCLLKKNCLKSLRWLCQKKQVVRWPYCCFCQAFKQLLRCICWAFRSALEHSAQECQLPTWITLNFPYFEVRGSCNLTGGLIMWQKLASHVAAGR